MKKNTKKYEQYLQNERDRKKASWRTRTTEQIMEDRRRARERQKRFREKRKMMGIIVTGKSTDKKAVLTRSEREKQREYWRRKQAECRARKSAQKQRRYKEKDKKYHQQKREKSKTEPRSSKRRQCIPKDPHEFVSAIETMIDTATPRKQELLKQKNLVNTPRSRKKLLFYEHTSSIMNSAMKGNSEVKRKIIRNLSFLKKYRLNRTFSTFLGVSDSYVNKYSGVEGIKQPRSDALCADHKRSVEEFFKRADISTNLPTAKRIKKDMKERRVLDRPMAEVYKEFKEQHPEIKASFSSFVRNKPSNVESTRKQPWYGCLCDSYTNIDLKLKALNKVAAKSGVNIKVKDNLYEAASLTFCQKDGAYHKLKCINRQCESCGCDNIVRFYQPLAEKLSRDLVSYSKWERVKKCKKKEILIVL